LYKKEQRFFVALFIVGMFYLGELAQLVERLHGMQEVSVTQILSMSTS